MTQEEKKEIIDEVFEKLKNYIKKHLKVEVDSVYDPFSGNDDHYHETSVYFD